jgi:hypothetical protein
MQELPTLRPSISLTPLEARARRTCPPPRPPRPRDRRGLTPSLARAVAACMALAAPLACQQSRRTAHPQETIGSSSGSVLPFGCLDATAFTEGRTQILLRDQELPGPGAVLIGMEVHCQNTVALDYTSLEIDVFPTTARTLSVTFADNETLPVHPLLRATNLQVAFDSSGWSAIPVQIHYQHDGVSGLVIEVRKVVNPATAQFATMIATSNPVRVDLPPMACSFGGPGSGAATAAAAQTITAPLSIRLLWSQVPTVRLLGDSAPGGNQFGLGGSIGHTVDGTPGSLLADFVGTSFLDPPQTLGPILGRFLVQGVTLDFGFVPSTGSAQLVLPIPNDRNLIGLHLTYQSATLDQVTGLAQFTNGADLFVNP